MPVPSTITDLSQTAASNYPQGSDSPSTLDDVQRAHGSFIALIRDGKGLTTPATLASATTTDVGGQNTQFVEISGTTTITSLGTNYNGPRFLRFTGALVLTHNATTLNIPGAASITTTAGDTCVAIPNVALNGWNISNYTRASGIPTGVAASGPNTDITSLGNNTSTVYTTAGTSTAYTITPTPAIAAYAIGQSHFVNFNAACGAAPTITISGVATPPNLVKENSDGTFSNLAAGDIPINHRSRVTLISTTQALVEKMPQAFTLGSSIPTTSGAVINATGIPTWANRVTIGLNAVNTSSTSDLFVRAGNGSVETSGYADVVSSLITGSTITITTTGVRVSSAVTAGTSNSGVVQFTKVSGNIWVITHHLVRNDGIVFTGSGVKTFSAAIDRVQLTTVGGVDTFVSGSISVSYE